MISTWQDITQVMGTDLSIRIGTILAQSPLPTDGAAAAGDATQAALAKVLEILPSLLGAVAILFIGWLVAYIAKAIVQGLLSRTNIDNRIASGLTGSDSVEVEKFVGSLVFWVVLLITIVAVLDTLNLQVASQPLNSFLNQIGEFLPKLLGAGILLGVAWVVATVVRTVAVKALNAANLDERLNAQQDATGGNQLSISQTIGTALYWFIFLLFLMPVLDTLGLQEALGPVNTLVSEILAILPNILGAVIIGAIGWFVANIVRRIVTNLLATTGVDHIGSRFGLSQASTSGQSLSSILGTIVYVLILIPVAIAALNTLQIQAISVPAIAMLQQILNAIPLIFTAGAILAVAYFLGKFVSELVTNILTSIGFNNIFSILGLPTPARTSTVTIEGGEVPSPTSKTPSEIVGFIAFIGIMLFAAISAIDILNIPALTTLVTGITIILGRILSGVVVLAVGLFLANLAFNIITSSGNAQARIIGQIARTAIIVLVSAMALQQIGLAPDIVNLAFGLLLGALAVSLALSFGLGSRDIAKTQVQQWLNSFKTKQ